MNIESLAVPTLVVSLVVTIMGFLVSRSIGGVDRSLANLAGKVDALAAKDVSLSEGLVELRVRVSTMEREFLRKHRALDRLDREEPPP